MLIIRYQIGLVCLEVSSGYSFTSLLLDFKKCLQVRCLDTPVSSAISGSVLEKICVSLINEAYFLSGLRILASGNDRDWYMR